MFEVIFLIVLGIVWLVFASVQDIRTREIANWLNFSLVIFALGFRFFYSLFGDVGFGFFYQGLLGFGIFYLLGMVLYKGKLFGGGDVKLLYGLGAILGFSTDLLINIRIFALFLVLFLFVGGIYGLVVSIGLTFKHFSGFKKEFSKKLKQRRKTQYSIMGLGLVFMLLGFLESTMFYLGILIFVFPYLFVYAKSIDDSCMVKKIKTSMLREGDLLFKSVKVGGKTINVDWNGVSSREIGMLRKKHKFVLIKEGIAFSPTFLISFIIIVFMWFFERSWLDFIF